MTEASRLLEALRAAQAKDGGTMTAYTVLSSQNDPFRRDTAAGHQAITSHRLGLGVRRRVPAADRVEGGRGLSTP